MLQTLGDNALLSGNDQWIIRARSLDGCYEQQVQTFNGKTAYLQVPPRAMTFTVSDVTDYSQSNLVYLNYLINNSGKIEIDSLHIQEAKYLTTNEITDRLTLDLEYHLPPIIELIDTDMEFLCGNNTRQAIVNSGSDYELTFSVSELFDVPCTVKSGYLRIINGAADTAAPVIVEYDESLGTGKFGKYTFTAGWPNPVTPHRWALQVAYYSDAGIFQGAYYHEIFVNGSISAPGSGILVDLGEENEVPLPLFVLRDPPGDGSYSAIAEGYSSTSMFTFEERYGAGLGPYTNNKFDIAGAGIELQIGAMAGNYNTETRELSITSQLTSEIKTSDAAAGRGASIVVGAGVAMQYGIKDDYQIECEGDAGKITVNRSIGFTPYQINTTWAYTVEFIEDLIAQYTQDSVDIANGSKALFPPPTDSDPDPMAYSTEEALNMTSVFKNNWKQVLRFYDYEANPIYQLIHTDYTDSDIYPQLIKKRIAGDDLNLNEEANKWRDALKSDIGDDPNILFNQEDLDKYNNAATAIRELMAIRFAYEEIG